MITKYISELVSYGKANGLIEECDEIYVTNRLLELFDVMEYDVKNENSDTKDLSESQKCENSEEKHKAASFRPVHEILEDMVKYAFENGIMKEDTITAKDLFDTKIMGCITPPPSIVRKEFKDKYAVSPKAATDFYYSFSQAANYIRKDRIARDEKWVTDTEYGEIDITINLSKPEKDPRDIAKAGKAKKSGYPACLLCKENEGYAGHFSHPARQNHRIIPVTLDGQQYYMQYSPYVYYNEHCIIFNAEHTPMKIDHAVFKKILDFVRQFPHYMAGSNADLHIVGGSILSHDHFQGGHYTFAMAKAPMEETVTIPGYEDVEAGIVKWPLSVLRIRSKDEKRLIDLASHVLDAWRGYTDEAALVFAETDGEPHNTITPIARKKGDMYELDLTLRNNVTTEEHPLGVYHPHAEYHHIKKENIGLIEVMGLAVLPARLKEEMELLAEYLVEGKNPAENEVLEKHAAWVAEFAPKYEKITKENVMDILHEEVGQVFVHVLEDAGVYKCTEEGREAFRRFLAVL